MPGEDIITIGAPTGGVEALKTPLVGLPAELPPKGRHEGVPG